MPKTFTSPEPYYAQVKEELKSYFATGAIDDLLFPIWLKEALSKFYKSQYPIFETLIEIDNFMGELPCDFESVKGAWACHQIYSNPILNQGSYYEQIDCRITPFDDKCHECFDDGCTTLNPDYAVTIRHTGKTWFTYSLSHLLRPATAHTLTKCGDECENRLSTCDDTFDIRDNKISVSFRTGKVHLTYYSTNIDDETGEQLVPSDEFTKAYIIAFLKFKCFETLSNSVTDESINIIERKLQRAELVMNSTRIIATTEMKKETLNQMSNRINRVKTRFNNYRRRLR